jgi:hypothetical protein
MTSAANAYYSYLLQKTEKLSSGVVNNMVKENKFTHMDGGCWMEFGC